MVTHLIATSITGIEFGIEIKKFTDNFQKNWKIIKNYGNKCLSRSFK